jgi:hypothetical protein
MTEVLCVVRASRHARHRIPGYLRSRSVGRSVMTTYARAGAVSSTCLEVGACLAEERAGKSLIATIR